MAPFDEIRARLDRLADDARRRTWTPEQQVMERAMKARHAKRRAMLIEQYRDRLGVGRPVDNSPQPVDNSEPVHSGR